MVVRANGARDAVAVVIVAVRFIGLAGMVGVGELPGGVVGVVIAGQRRDALGVLRKALKYKARKA